MKQKLMPIINKLQNRFNDLSPDVKKRLVMTVGIILFVVITLFMYRAKQANSDIEPVTQQSIKEQVISLNEKDDDLAKQIGLQGEIRDAKAENAEKNRQIEALNKQVAALNSQLAGNTSVNLDNTTLGDLKFNNIPPSHIQPQVVTSQPEYRQEIEVVKAPPIVITGAIGKVTGVKSSTESKPQEQSKKYVNFLPAGSILKGLLLNGMFAPTMSQASSKPYPALMRINDLGFLPNEVRKDLSGCFVLGQAYGELSDSRVHVRLETISCISNNRKKVLEKAIMGFVSGDDGKVGVLGEIRANFGKVALGALLAEFLSAAGDAIESSTQIVTQNPLGGVTTTSNLTEQDLLVSAAAAGFGESASMIAEFYLEIMKAMTPVIEVSGRRDVEIIVSKGIELALDDWDWQGVKENEKIDFDTIFNN